MKVRTLLTFVAFAATLFSSQANAQINKRERLLQVLDQSRQSDYIPAFFNIHFADKSGWKAVKAHIDWFRQTHVDLVNVKYEYFPIIQKVNNPSEWKNVKAWDHSVWDDQLLVVRELKRELGNEALIIPTVFSPLRVLIQATGSSFSYDREGRKAVVELIRKNPKAILPALKMVTDQLVYYIREARKAGADGFYISSQGDDLEEFGGKVFQEILKPYDRQLADAAAEVAPFNILHICESGGHFTPETFNDYLDYPGSVINPPLHNFKDKSLDLAQISQLFNRPVLGGIGYKGAFLNGTIEEAKAEIDELLKNAPKNYIFGADDSLPNDVDPERVRILVDYVHTWRQTHK